MITYPLDDTLEQSIISLIVEHQSEPIGFDSTAVPVAFVELDGQRAQVQLLITTEEDDFIENESIPTIDFLTKKE